MILIDDSKWTRIWCPACAATTQLKVKMLKDNLKLICGSCEYLVATIISKVEDADVYSD